MGIYGTIFRKLTGKEKKPKTKKRKTMAKKKIKISPEKKAKILAGLKKVGGQVVKYSSGKPTVKVTTKKTVTPPTPTEKKEAVNFWNSPIDMGFIKPTGKQLVIGGSTTLIGGALLYKTFK